MASSNSHKFGQMIGNFLEQVVFNELKILADKYDFFIDYKHPRKARNNAKEVIWIDAQSNSHKLDFVIERNGTDSSIGEPKAFVEVAWRRYAKHSKNKAQEMAGAILPLIEEYGRYSPFYGVFLAGVFTAPALNQLKSLGFKVVYFDLHMIFSAFSKVGIHIQWEEDTEESVFQGYIEQFSALDSRQLSYLGSYILQENIADFNDFTSSLTCAFERKVDKIRIFALHGSEVVVNTALDAIKYVTDYNEMKKNDNGIIFIQYDMYVKYSNGDKVEGSFKTKATAINFLKNLQY